MQYSSDFHKDTLKEALVLAQSRRGFCAPNPAVGAVVVKNNKVIGQGRHFAAGSAHAEVEALRGLGDEARGATLYVTLEPCCHWGKTPPCTELIIKSGIREVYYALRDPNFVVAGKGEQALHHAGIPCHQVELSEITEFYESYVYWLQRGLPKVTAKIAMSLDGKIAGANGKRTLITGEALQHYTHQWRQQSDALLTTINTVIQDDPRLTVRLEGSTIKKPIYVLDSQLQFPLTATLLSTSGRLTILHAANIKNSRKKELTAAGVRCVGVNTDQKGLNLLDMLKIIGEDGVHDLWVEAGGKCFQSLLSQHLLNRAFIYVAPVVLGPDATPAFTGALNIQDGAKEVRWRALGLDALCELSY